MASRDGWSPGTYVAGTREGKRIARSQPLTQRLPLPQAHATQPVRTTYARTAPASYRGVPIVRRGRDWLETLLFRATGSGWDSVGPGERERRLLDEAARAAAAEWDERGARTLARERTEAHVARLHALGVPTHGQREAAARERGQERCVADHCSNDLDGYASAWRRAHDGYGFCRDCDEAMDRDFPS